MKNTIITVIVLAIIAVLFYFGYQKMITSDSVDVQEQPETVVKEFGEFSDFVRADLTDDEKMELKQILEQRDAKVAEMKQILADEFAKDEAERDMETAYAKIAEIREEIRSQILPFIDGQKADQFEIFFNTLGAEIESDYILK